MEEYSGREAEYQSKDDFMGLFVWPTLQSAAVGSEKSMSDCNNRSSSPSTNVTFVSIIGTLLDRPAASTESPTVGKVPLLVRESTVRGGLSVSDTVRSDAIVNGNVFFDAAAVEVSTDFFVVTGRLRTVPRSTSSSELELDLSLIHI